MGKLLDNSPYSYHFKILTALGAWVVDPTNESRELFYVIYKTFMTLLCFIGISSLLVDLYDVFGDVQKTSWNLCITTLFVGGLTKFFFVFYNFPVVNNLRQRLHEDAESRTLSQHLFAGDLALKEFNYLRVILLLVFSISIPIWLVTIYLGTEGNARSLPLPMRFPFAFDKEDDVQYNIMFALVGACGVAGAFFVLQCELCMFSILIQITREYWIFMKDISLLSDLGNSKKGETVRANGNPISKKRKIKNHLKHIHNRQHTLIQYTKDFNRCYNKALLVHILTVTIVVVVIGIQLILMPLKLSGFLSFQIGYTFLLLGDAFLVCWFATRLTDLCYKVGDVAYDTLWYKMDLDIQKDLRMLIMRSQRPPFITVAKLMILNLNTFLHVMRNIYSWLALFRELEHKGDV